ncbi:Helix-turn-helix domain-containing protein [Microlunatus soli]|uniref:Helix-turn-helix domain-containing protein n=1 Tax=Microlunatus soli TaxID=630515 RepID=A0A1H1Z397_9ACTN|nr:Helix-turn-helix domain-containing protein [Microlunatus soli]
MLLADYPPGAVFGPRVLHSWEFVWLLEGSATWDWQRAGGSDQMVLRPGMLALATVGMRDRLRWDPDRASRHAYVHFDLDLAGDGDASGWMAGTGWPAVRDFAEVPLLASLCDYLIELAERDDPAAIERAVEVLTLLLKVFLDGPVRGAESDLGRHLSAAVDHVRRVWLDGVRIVTVDDLSTATGLSAGHLHRLFRDRYGCGPARALELIRLARAAVALQRSNQSLAEIATGSGYTNAYHFSRRFTGVYGLRPGAFRKQGEEIDPYQPVRDAGLLPIAHRLAGPIR